MPACRACFRRGRLLPYVPAKRLLFCIFRKIHQKYVLTIPGKSYKILAYVYIELSVSRL